MDDDDPLNESTHIVEVNDDDEIYKKALAAVTEDGMNLNNIHPNLKGNEIIVATAVKQNGMALSFAYDDMKKNLDIVEAAVKQTGMALQFAHEDLKRNQRIVEAAVKQDGEVLHLIHDELIRNPVIVEAAVKQNGMVLYLAHDEMKRDPAIIEAAVKQNGLALQYAHEDLKRNQTIVEIAVKQNGEALQYANNDMKRNKKIVEAAVKQNGRALQYAHDDLKRNQRIVEAAVKQDGEMLLLAHDDMKKNLVIVEAAVKQNGEVLNHVHDDMKRDPNIVNAAVKQNGIALKYSHDDMKKNPTIVEAAVKQSGCALRYAHDDLKRNQRIVEAAVKQSGLALVYAHTDMKKDLTIVQIAVEQKSEIFQYVNDDMKSNPKIVETAVKQNGWMLQYANDDMKSNPKVLEIAVKQNVEVLSMIVSEFNNREFYLSYLENCAAALEYATDSYFVPYQKISPVILNALKYESEGRTILHNWVYDETKAGRLKALVKADRNIVDVKNQDGKRAIDRAIPECKHAMESALWLFERFDVSRDDPIIHKSCTACVFKALDTKNNTFVALKCMNEHSQVLAEIEGRKGLTNCSDNSFIVELKSVYIDSSIQATSDLEKACESNRKCKRIVVNANTDNLKNEVNEIISSKEIHGQQIEKEEEDTYNYVLEFEYGERTLDLILTHLRVEPSTYQTKKFFVDIVDALIELHGRGRIHGDLKPLNVVLVQLKLKLIDLDVSCKIGEFYGAKPPSTAYCPPEVAKCLFDQKIEHNHLQSFKAAISHDLFSLGVILYQMESRQSLWQKDQDDNIDEDQEQELVEFLGSTRNKKLNRVQNEIARDLLTKLLDPNPIKRIAHFDKDYNGIDHANVLLCVKKHAYICGNSDLKSLADVVKEVREKVTSIENNLNILKGLSTELNDELKLTREVLIHAIYEADEVHTPTTFVILQNKIPDKFVHEDERQILGINLADNGSSFQFENDVSDPIKGVMSNLEQARNWVTSFADTTKSITESDPVKFFQDVKKTFSNLMTEETMYFYLIDELTGKPLIGDGYPIEITKPSDFVPKMLPFVQCGMRAISLCNGTAGICQMFGFPFPKVPDSIVKEMRECMLILKQSSSVEAFEAVHQKVEDGDGRSTTVRGSSLSVLEDFFTKYDCEKRYAGLRRIAGKDGGAIWTAVPDDDVEKYLRYRVAMRKKEEIENIAALRSIRNEIVENRKRPEEEQEPLNSYCYDCFLRCFSIR